MESNEDAAVQDFLEILEEHRKNCERQGKYVEAEIAKNRLDELKLHEENRRRVSSSLYCIGVKSLIFTYVLYRKQCGRVKLRKG
jgi:hypothetical protein